MDTRVHTAPPDIDHLFTIDHLLDAPRELVWACWTEAERLRHWFGPQGVTVTAARMDLRPQGSFHYCLTTPEGTQMWGKWSFVRIEAPRRLESISAFSDAAGDITRHPLSATWPLQTYSVVELQEQGDKTLLTIQWSPYQASAEEIATFDASHAAMTGGWNGTFKRLEAYLASLK